MGRHKALTVALTQVSKKFPETIGLKAAFHLINDTNTRVGGVGGCDFKSGEPSSPGLPNKREVAMYLRSRPRDQ